MSAQFTWLIGDIDGKIVSDVFSFCVQMQQKGATRITLLMSSYGGDLASGFALHNIVKSFPVPIETHNIGHVGSVAAVAFLAGRRRYACASSLFLFHGFLGHFAHAVNVPRTVVAEKLAMLDHYERLMRTVFLERTRVEESAIEAFLKCGETRGADVALDTGVIHEIREVW